jgi:hypothetical protein
MGTLDDAIREHLELKRQHGASDDEVKRQEDEALGRSPSAPTIEPAQATAEPRAEVMPEPEIVPEPLPDPVPEPIPEPIPEPTPEPVPEPIPEPIREPTPVGEEVEALPVDRDEVLPEEALEPEPVEREIAEPAFESEDPGPSQEPAVMEEVLEETPEFLEETPDSDRLWFEQRPPKDFDLD